MKFVALLIAAIALSSPAHAWEKVLSCNGNSAVIDRGDAGPRGTLFQLVIRQPEAVLVLSTSGAVTFGRINTVGEAILPLRINRDNSGEFIGDEDAFQPNGRIYYVKPQGQGLILEAFRTSQPFGGTYTLNEKIGAWNFGPCTR